MFGDLAVARSYESLSFVVGEESVCLMDSFLCAVIWGLLFSNLGTAANNLLSVVLAGVNLWLSLVLVRYMLCTSRVSAIEGTLAHFLYRIIVIQVSYRPGASKSVSRFHSQLEVVTALKGAFANDRAPLHRSKTILNALNYGIVLQLVPDETCP